MTRQGSYGPDGRWHDATTGLRSPSPDSAMRAGSGLGEDGRARWQARLARTLEALRLTRGLAPRWHGLRWWGPGR